MLGIVASTEDPIAQGRHKVWGSRPLWVPPQTSTIACHLPKAVGLAFASRGRVASACDRACPPTAIVPLLVRRCERKPRTALAAFNAARYAVRSGLPMPVLLSVRGQRHRHQRADARAAGSRNVRDRGRISAISTPTARLDEIWDAVAWRDRACARDAPADIPAPADRRDCVGHAGSDVEQTYRSLAEIEAIEAGDPLLRMRRALIETGAAAPESCALVRDTRERVRPRLRG